MKPLLVLGSINADLYIRVAALPRPGETIPGREAAVRPGGKGANQAAAAARQGYPVRFAGYVGDDSFAPMLRRALTDTGADASLLRSAPGPSGQALILLQDGGENSIILVPGANHAWPAGIDRLLAEAITGAGVLLLQREIPEAINSAAAAEARRQQVPVVLDVGGDDGPIAPELLACLSVISPNETELERLTGMPADTAKSAEAAARVLLARGPSAVLVKRGAEGALWVPREGPALAHPAYRARVVDTTGAGDCFTATVAAGMCAGLSPEHLLGRACAAASVCVEALGAMPAMPDAAAVAAREAQTPGA